MGVSLGHVPHHEWRADPLVLHRQLRGRGVLSVRCDWFSSSSSYDSCTLQWHLSKCLSAGILSMIIIRTLRKDIANYNREDDIVRWLIGRLPSDIHLLYCVASLLSFFCCYRRTQWRNLAGRTSMEMCSAHLSIPWYLAPCWDLASSSSAWFSLLSVSTLLRF